MTEAARERAIEALGGTPPEVTRPPASPVRQVLPGAIGRRVGDFDRAVDRASSRLRGRPVADRIFYSASALGDFSLVWHLVATGRALRSERHEREAVRLATALVVESVVVNGVVKSLFRRERPTIVDPRPHRLRHPRSSSFPSGHATSAFMAATILSEGGRRRSAPAWYALAAVVAASRVHVRIHHGSDVAAGAVIGIGVGRLVRRLWPLR